MGNGLPLRDDGSKYAAFYCLNNHCLWDVGYVDFSGKMSVKLTNSAGPSATHMGQDMSSSIENKALGVVGLDQKTRGSIEASADERLKVRSKALDNAKKNSKKSQQSEWQESENTETISR